MTAFDPGPGAPGGGGLTAQSVTPDETGEVAFDVANGGVVMLNIDADATPNVVINQPVDPQPGQYMTIVLSVLTGAGTVDVSWIHGRGGFLTPLGVGAVLVAGEWIYQGEDGGWLEITPLGYDAETGATTVDGDLAVDGGLTAQLFTGLWKASASNTAVGEAGAGDAPPATPERYLRVRDENGTELAIPAYLPAIT